MPLISNDQLDCEREIKTYNPMARAISKCIIDCIIRRAIFLHDLAIFILDSNHIFQYRVPISRNGWQCILQKLIC